MADERRANKHRHHHRTPTGRGAKPGFADQLTQTSLGKPARVPGDPDSPNADAFDQSPETEELRPTDVPPTPIPPGDDPLRRPPTPEGDVVVGEDVTEEIADILERGES